MEYTLSFSQHQQGLKEGRFQGLRCNDCEESTYPPQGVCRNCGGHDLKVVEMEGAGAIQTFTVVRVAPEGKRAPYVIAMVELEEGPWVMGNLEGILPDEAGMDLIGRQVRLGSRAAGEAADPDEDLYVQTFTLVQEK